MPDYCQPQDIVRRLFYRGQIWYHVSTGADWAICVPDVELIGDEGAFGELRFQFEEATETFKIWIKHPDELLETATDAIENMKPLITSLFVEE